MAPSGWKWKHFVHSMGEKSLELGRDEAGRIMMRRKGDGGVQREETEAKEVG